MAEAAPTGLVPRLGVQRPPLSGNECPPPAEEAGAMETPSSAVQAPTVATPTATAFQPRVSSLSVYSPQDGRARRIRARRPFLNILRFPREPHLLDVAMGEIPVPAYGPFADPTPSERMRIASLQSGRIPSPSTSIRTTAERKWEEEQEETFTHYRDIWRKRKERVEKGLPELPLRHPKMDLRDEEPGPKDWHNTPAQTKEQKAKYETKGNYYAKWGARTQVMEMFLMVLSKMA